MERYDAEQLSDGYIDNKLSEPVKAATKKYREEGYIWCICNAMAEK